MNWWLVGALSLGASVVGFLMWQESRTRAVLEGRRKQKAIEEEDRKTDTKKDTKLKEAEEKLDETIANIDRTKPTKPLRKKDAIDFLTRRLK